MTSGSGACEDIGRRQSVPVLHVRGTHYEVGFDTGRTFSGIIKSFLKEFANLRDFEKEYKTDVGRRAFDQTLKNMRARFPYYVKEIQGYADGAGVPFYQLFLLHMDDIIGTISDNSIPRNDTGGCSDIGINRPGQAILGHTEDALEETLNHFYILQAHVVPSPEDQANGAVEERFASLCYAGQLPGYTMGFNEYGMVFSINTLSAKQLKPGHSPRTFVTRALLTARSLPEAERILLDEGLGVGNGFSVNIFWSAPAPRGPHQLINVEVAPNPRGMNSLISVEKYSEAPLNHCNLYLRLPVPEVIGPIIDSSHARLELIRQHPPPQTRADVADIISDRSGKEYTIFQDRSDAPVKTIAAGIFDLEKRTWSIYINQPNNSEPIAVIPMQFTQLGQ